MKIFIGMETSGMLRTRFVALGHDVISCDTLSAEDGAEFGNHIVGDVFETLDLLRRMRWWPDMAIFHPTCTYLTISAAWAFNDPDYDRYPDVGYHQKVKPGTLTGQARRQAREAAVNDVRRIDALPIARKAVENPIGALSSMFRKPDQIIQPYQFGDDASKSTCLWTWGLPPLQPTKRVDGRMVEWPRGSGRMVERWSNQTDSGQNALPPSNDRWKDRSRTYPGIADAMASQWGK